MEILIKTDTGQYRGFNTDNIAFYDGSEADVTKVYLKTNLDFDIRVDLNVKDFFKVIKGEVDFFDVYKTKGLAEYREEKTEVEEKKVEEEVKEKKPIPSFATKRKLDGAKKKEQTVEEPKKKESVW